MKIYIIIIFILCVACQGKKKDPEKTETAVNEVEAVAVIEDIICNAEVCLQLQNHDAASQSFEIYMLNSIPVAGFQCDFPGINIIESDGGLLKENGYQTSNSASRILSFSMQARLIPVGEGILTTVYYSDPTMEACMTEIIFAGMGGEQLSNNAPECMQLN